MPFIIPNKRQLPACLALSAAALAQAGGAEPERKELSARASQSATRRVTDAPAIVHQMEAEPRMRQALAQAANPSR